VFIGSRGLFLGSCSSCSEMWVDSAPKALRQHNAYRPMICPTNGQSGSGLILGWEIYDAINHHSILLFVVLLVFRFFYLFKQEGAQRRSHLMSRTRILYIEALQCVAVCCSVLSEATIPSTPTFYESAFAVACACACVRV